jgi:hypothetical protein
MAHLAESQLILGFGAFLIFLAGVLRHFLTSRPKGQESSGLLDRSTLFSNQ